MDKNKGKIFLAIVIITAIGLFFVVNFTDLLKGDKKNQKTVPQNSKPIMKTEKPVIYLYPIENTKISVKLDLAGEMTRSYPDYKNGWNVTANSRGILWDDEQNVFTSLYWEGNLGNYEIKEGFTVHKDDVESFLHEKLGILGLNRTETKEFINYWINRIRKNEYSDISFIGKEYSDRAKIITSPKADTEIRVFMIFREGSKESKLPLQKLVAVKRRGFTIVEWGGAQLDKVKNQ